VNVLILKLGATGDVVRTTPLLHRLKAHVTWVTAAKNVVLLSAVKSDLRCFSWEERQGAADRQYDLAINLEDTVEAAEFLKCLKCEKIFGAYADSENHLRYTENAARWFDLSLISAYGKDEADKRKFRNRSTYQEMIFAGLALHFAGEPYFLPPPIETGLSGDVAIAADSGPVWPMKKWAYYQELKEELERERLTVNVLPERRSLLEHLSDVQNHRCLVGGDSLPMHFALGTKTPCVTLFTCTSPWEIYDYGVQKKIISPLLGEFFYQRGYNERATRAIGLAEVKHAVLEQLETAQGKLSMSGSSWR
jgi:heptosyltransferase II